MTTPTCRFCDHQHAPNVLECAICENKTRVHRWQPTLVTPCGLYTSKVRTNVGRYLNAGVTCKRCEKASAYLSMLGDSWNGQSMNYADQRRK